MRDFDFSSHSEDVRNGKDIRRWRWCRLIGGPRAGDIMAIDDTCSCVTVPMYGSVVVVSKGKGEYHTMQYVRKPNVPTYFESTDL